MFIEWLLDLSGTLLGRQYWYVTAICRVTQDSISIIVTILPFDVEFARSMKVVEIELKSKQIPAK